MSFFDTPFSWDGPLHSFPVADSLQEIISMHERPDLWMPSTSSRPRRVSDFSSEDPSDDDNDNNGFIKAPTQRYQPIFHQRPDFCDGRHRKCHHGPDSTKQNANTPAPGSKSCLSDSTALRASLMESYEAVVDVQLADGFYGWVEASCQLAVFQVDLPKKEKLREYLEDGNAHDKLYVKMLVLIQEGFISLERTYSGLWGLGKRRARMPPLQMKTFGRFMDRMKRSASKADWKALREIALKYPSPNSIHPPHPKQSPFILHRLLFHLLYPLDKHIEERKIITLYLRNLLPAHDHDIDKIRSERQMLMDFRWMEWVMWLLHAGDIEGVRKLSEMGKRTERHSGAQLLEGLGSRLRHVFLRDNLFLSLIPSEIMLLTEGVECICEQRVTRGIGYVRPALPSFSALRLKHAHPKAGDREVEQSLTQCYQYHLDSDTTSLANDRLYQDEQARYFASLQKSDDPPITGTPSLVSLAIDKLRRMIDPVAAEHDLLVNTVTIARFLGQTHHRDIDVTGGASALASNLSGEAHDKQILAKLATTNRIPMHLLASIAYSFQCGDCGLFILTSIPPSPARDVVCRYRELPRVSQQSARPRPSRSEAVEYLRLCMRCRKQQEDADDEEIRKAQMARELSVQNARDGIESDEGGSNWEMEEHDWSYGDEDSSGAENY